MTDRRQDGGALFKNDRKEKDSHPDYRGDITIDGRKYWLSGWLKEGKRGKYMSLAVRAADDQPQEAKPQPRNANEEASGRGIEDEMPF
jgi:hypothetical protein